MYLKDFDSAYVDWKNEIYKECDLEDQNEMNAHVLAGMISTTNFKPSENHPEKCLPIANLILKEIGKSNKLSYIEGLQKAQEIASSSEKIGSILSKIYNEIQKELKELKE